jgi:hypothetical protein
MYTMKGTSVPLDGDRWESLGSGRGGTWSLISGRVDGGGFGTTNGFVVRDGVPIGPDEGDGEANGEACVANDECFEDATRSRYAETLRYVSTVTTPKKSTAPKAICPTDNRREMPPKRRCNMARSINLSLLDHR